jgi:protein-L-isoaspartate(D-aspartate) O-methyltransferase
MNPRQVGLVDALIHRGVITSPRVAQVMKTVDRACFVRKSDSSAYADSPKSIGFGATISAPHMHAYALEWLEPYLKPHAAVLDVGSGSGYLTVCFGMLLEGQGRVYGVDHIPELVEFSRQNISHSYPDMLSDGLLQVQTADGRLGLSEFAPYQAIHVGAASPTIPQALVDQLASGGRMVIPVGEQGSPQDIYLVDKDSCGSVSTHKTFEVYYVPLTSQESQIK